MMKNALSLFTKTIRRKKNKKFWICIETNFLKRKKSNFDEDGFQMPLWALKITEIVLRHTYERQFHHNAPICNVRNVDLNFRRNS